MRSAAYPKAAEALQAITRRAVDLMAQLAFRTGQLNKAREWRSEHTAGNREWPRERVKVRTYIRQARIECHALAKRLDDALDLQAEVVRRLLN